MNSAQVIALALCISMDFSSAIYMKDHKTIVPPPDQRIISKIIKKQSDPNDLNQYALPPIGEVSQEEGNSRNIFWGPGYDELKRHLPIRQQIYALEDQIPNMMKKLFGIVLKFKDVCQDERVKMFKELGEIFKENLRREDAEKTRLKEKLIDFLVKAATVVTIEEEKH